MTEFNHGPTLQKYITGSYDRNISRNYIRGLYYGIVLLNYLTGLYRGIILRDYVMDLCGYITGLAYSIMLRVCSMEFCYGNRPPGTPRARPWDHLGTLPGTLGHPRGAHGP